MNVFYRDSDLWCKIVMGNGHPFFTSEYEGVEIVFNFYRDHIEIRSRVGGEHQISIQYSRCDPTILILIGIAFETFKHYGGESEVGRVLRRLKYHDWL